MSSMEKQPLLMFRVLKRVRHAMGQEANPVQAPKPARIATDAVKSRVHKAFFPCRRPAHVVVVKVESFLIRVDRVKVKALCG
jgi:hypothetical protein